MLDLSTVDRLLTTTRSVRRRLDLERPVEPEVIERCLEIGMQAPSGSDGQRWQFVVITDAQLRWEIGELYRRSYAAYAGATQADAAGTSPVRRSADYLAENFHRVPVLVLACYEGRVERAEQFQQASLYGSILPATWSMMLALRARGLGSVWTTLHLRYAAETAALLGLPEKLTQAALIPVAYFTGDDFQPAKRASAAERISWNGWQKRREEG